MTEPFFDETTERAYVRLPGVYKFEDTTHDWTMKRFMSGPFSVLQDINTLVDRFTYVPIEDGYFDTVDLHSDLVDPTTADVAWLPWLAQLVGVSFDHLLDESLQRDRILHAFDGARPGTDAAIIQATQTILTGTKTVYVYPFSNDVFGVGGGSQWEVLILTLAAETSGDVIATVTKLGAKPAGVKLYHTTFSADWDTIEANRPTWADWEAVNWEQLEQET